MTALLTDAVIQKESDGYAGTPGDRKLLTEGFIYGARFARSIYEARLAEEEKVRAGLVASLQNLVTAICKVQDWDGTRVGSALDDVDAALAAVEETK